MEGEREPLRSQGERGPLRLHVERQRERVGRGGGGHLKNDRQCLNHRRDRNLGRRRLHTKKITNNGSDLMLLGTVCTQR